MASWIKLIGGVVATAFSVLLLSQAIEYRQQLFSSQLSDGCEADTTDFVIHGDDKGHFRGQALVNGVSMPFLIDTGASMTAVPAHLAKTAGLPIGENRMVDTANGISQVKSSKINELKIGNAVLKNTEAFISDSLDEVLIGMTALKHFEMRLDSNTLILTANKGYDVDISKSHNWNKHVVCNDDGQDCKTVYSKQPK